MQEQESRLFTTGISLKNPLNNVNNSLNIVVWGLGRHALNRILPAIQQCESLNLYGVCTRNTEVLVSTSEYYQCRAFNDELEMLNDVNVDAIYLATPIGLHYEQGKSVLHAGKHLYCEKPLVNKHRHALELVELASSKKLSIFEAFMYLYHPQYQHLKEYISANFANLVIIESRFTIPSLESPGFRHNPELGGSALYDIGCYPVSLLLDLLTFQEAEVKYSEIKYSDELGVDSRGNILLECKSGVRVSLDWGMGVGYENSVRVLTKVGKLYADKIFSKPDNHETVTLLYDKYGNGVEQISFSGNQFVLMFEAFSKKLDNQFAIQDEYNKILQRAEFLEKINESTTF